MPQKRTQAHPRSRGRVIVRYGKDGLERTGFTTNLSLSGAFVHTNQVFKPGTLIQVELVAKEAKASLKAEVVWAKVVPPQLAHLLPCGMGLRFIDPDMRWREFYESWCDRGLAVSRAR
jgi:Tfp pilus assembly protein PilZ